MLRFVVNSKAVVHEGKLFSNKSSTIEMERFIIEIAIRFKIVEISSTKNDFEINKIFLPHLVSEFYLLLYSNDYFRPNIFVLRQRK